MSGALSPATQHHRPPLAAPRVLPLLPPHLHSVLFHSIVGPASDGTPRQSRHASFNALHTPVGSLRPPCGPSPDSANTSLGNGSPSVRGQTTDTKRLIYATPSTSPARLSATIKTNSAVAKAISPAMAGRALEQDLMHAGNEELVQMLLELSSCSPEAAQFIYSKARLLSLRHTASPPEHSTQHFQSPNTNTQHSNTQQQQQQEIIFSQQRLQQSGEKSLGIADRCGDNSRATPSKPLAFEDDNSCECSPTRCDVRILPEDRSFLSSFHPCLRWYGGCRHSASCLFASTPQNLCLNWIRGACVAGVNCTGVHRLPDICPPEVRTVFALSHGADRTAVARAQQRIKSPQTFNHLSALNSPSPLHYAQHTTAEETVNQKEKEGYNYIHMNTMNNNNNNNVNQSNDNREELRSLVERNGLVTPTRQVLLEPDSIPASLEHFNHARQHPWSKNAESPVYWSPSDEQNNNVAVNTAEISSGQCDCRVCRSPNGVAVPRCLQESFTLAAEEDAADTEMILETNKDNNKKNKKMDNDDEEEKPPSRVHTRTQSPVEA